MRSEDDLEAKAAAVVAPLEVHPGSPIDLSGRRRPSLAAAMASQRPVFSAEALEQLPIGEALEKCITTDGVVAKSTCKCEYLDTKNRPTIKLQTAATQAFFIPASVPEQLETHNLPSPSDDGMSLDSVIESDLDFDFQEENGVWISAVPKAVESRSSVTTCSTTVTSLADGRYHHNALVVECGLTSSSASVLSATSSALSGSTNCSDIYGWEEELDRKSSMDLPLPHLRDHQRRLPPGGRPQGPYLQTESVAHRQTAGKRKSLLHRVLNISRRDLNEPLPSTRVMTFPGSMN